MKFSESGNMIQEQDVSVEISNEENVLIEKIEENLDRLPITPKKQQLTERFENNDNLKDLKNLDIEISELLKKIEKIKNAPTRFSPAIYKTETLTKELSETDNEKNLVLMRQLVKEAKENMAQAFIGDGSTAEVFSSLEDKRWCIKIINNFEEYKLVNDISKEFDFLCKLSDLNVSNVRVPKPAYAYIDEEVHVCVMENLKAVTLSSVLDGTKQLPEKFNQDTFFDNLRDFILEMHESTKIHHRDLSAANIMIDSETGHPYVIDFGKSVHQFADDPYLDRNEDTKTVTKYKNDLDEVEQHRNSMRKFLFDKEK